MPPPSALPGAGHPSCRALAVDHGQGKWSLSCACCSTRLPSLPLPRSCHEEPQSDRGLPRVLPQDGPGALAGRRGGARAAPLVAASSTGPGDVSARRPMCGAFVFESAGGARVHHMEEWGHGCPRRGAGVRLQRAATGPAPRGSTMGFDRRAMRGRGVVPGVRSGFRPGGTDWRAVRLRCCHWRALRGVPLDGIGPEAVIGCGPSAPAAGGRSHATGLDTAGPYR